VVTISDVLCGWLSLLVGWLTDVLLFVDVGCAPLVLLVTVGRSRWFLDSLLVVPVVDLGRFGLRLRFLLLFGWFVGGGYVVSVYDLVLVLWWLLMVTLR